METVDTENLRRVWEYVSQGRELPDERPDIAARLRAFIEREAAESEIYMLLAQKTRGTPAERTLRAIAVDERSHERRLQAEYFLLTGDTWPRVPRRPSAPYLLAALRERYLNEQKDAEEYERMAETLPDGNMRTVIREIAADERRHESQLRSIIESTIY